jgi:hypothetical protein
MMAEGEVPNHLLAESLLGKFENIQKVIDKLIGIFNDGKLLPSMAYT